MKKSLLYLLLLLLLLLLFLWWWKCCRDTSHQPPSKFPPVKTFQAGTNTLTSPYEPNELILNYASTTPQSWIDDNRSYLTSKGFNKADSCHCSRNLELWRRNGAPDEVDLIGVIKGAPPPPPQPIGEGISLNFNLTPTFQDPKLVEYGVQIPDSGPTITVGVVDGGVDYDHYPFDGSPFLWVNPDPMSCNKAKLGIDLLAPGQEPKDKQGHGTEVNGIILGASEPVFNGGLNASIRVLNTKFTVGNTTSGTLFQAVCGLYYAKQEGAKILNVSWGYLDTIAPNLMLAFLSEAEKENVVVVAGMGNNGIRVDGQLKFWPACFANQFSNVISVGAANYPGSGLASFSNWSSDPNTMTVLAPGTNVRSTYPRDLPGSQGGAICEGTSMAVPFVTRLAAIMQANRSTSPGVVRDRIRNTATQQPFTLDGTSFTLRHLNHTAALNGL